MATSAARTRHLVSIENGAVSDATSTPVRPAGILQEPLLDASQAARLLGIPRSSVYEYAKRGELPHVKLGRHVKFIRSDLERALAERRIGV